MTEVNYYEILGLEEGASPEEIKKAFRKKAAELHPDRNKEPDAESRFKKVNEAYQTLSDDEKRQQYDFSLQNPDVGHGFPGFSGFGGFGGGFGDIIDEMMNGGQQQRRHRSRGADVSVGITISVTESVIGCKKHVAVAIESRCDACNGTASKTGKMTKCLACNGIGYRAQSMGMISIRSSCPACVGTGTVPEVTCKSCHGGMKRNTKTITIDVPAGVPAGATLRVSGMGHAGPGSMPSGDLLVTIDVANDDAYIRKGNDIYVNTSVSFSQLVLGDTIEITHPDGTKHVAFVTRGSKPASQVRLKGKGCSGFGKTGDLIAALQLVIPDAEKLSDRAKELMTELNSLINS